MKSTFKLANFTLDLTNPQIMGVLNITQDSFSDGGLYLNANKARDRALAMIDQGVSIIDIGAESTRPGAQPITAEAELQRVVPLIEFIVNLNIPVSIDTNKAEVMQAAVDAGACLINDVCALQNEGAIETAAQLRVPVCLMHMQGSPQTMQENPHYDDVVVDIMAFFKERIKACEDAGIDKERIILDPGFGFGKTVAHNFSILKRLGEFKTLDLPLLVGLSRKSMIGAIINKPPEQRVSASIALAVVAWQSGANFIRVHDVAETKDALSMITALQSASGE